MDKNDNRIKSILAFLLFWVFPLLTACGGNQIVVESTPTVVPPTVKPDVPEITSVEPDRLEVPKYESVELTVAMDAKYTNPYDAREIALEGVFTSPDGREMVVPGFWDGEGSWRIRFTPSEEGT
jgi:hypothetical protein